MAGDSVNVVQGAAYATGRATLTCKVRIVFSTAMAQVINT